MVHAEEEDDGLVEGCDVNYIRWAVQDPVEDGGGIVLDHIHVEIKAVVI